MAFVTGGAGVMGSRLVRRLLRAGFRARVLVLPGDPKVSELAALGAEVFEGDICDAASLRNACNGVDMVYHLAAVIISHDELVFERVNRDGTANVLAESSRAGVRHFIYVSSASVVYPRRTPYAESKLQAERLVAGSGLPYTIVRPTLVYERGGGQELMMFLAYLRRFPVVPFIGEGSALKRPVWSEDVVDGLERLADKPIALGKTYNLSGGEAVTMLELARLLLQYLDRPRPFVHLPVPLCNALAAVLAAFMKRPALTQSAIAGVVNDANLDPSQAIEELGYHPLGVRAGFARCFQEQTASKVGDLSARHPDLTGQPQKGN